MVFSGSQHRALKSQQWQDTPRKWHILQECKNGPFLVDLEHFWVPRNYSQITRLADVVSLIRSSHSSILNTAHHEISSYFGFVCPDRNFSFLIFTRRYLNILIIKVIKIKIRESMKGILPVVVMVIQSNPVQQVNNRSMLSVSSNQIHFMGLKHVINVF